MTQQELIGTLYAPLQPIARKLLDLCAKARLDVRIPQTGAIRTTSDNTLIYGKERFTLHYLGLALDVEPVLHVAPEDWKRAYNAWPWQLLQEDLAVSAGFDRPQKWQLERDRPHNQCLFGVSESVLKSMWYASNGNKEECWRYIDLHTGVKV
jgi:hypothetical protein